MEIFRQYKLVI